MLKVEEVLNEKRLSMGIVLFSGIGADGEREGADKTDPGCATESAGRQRDAQAMRRLVRTTCRTGRDRGRCRDLSKDLTADKIKELKTKMITRKRTQIKPTDDEFAGADGSGGEMEAEMDFDRDFSAHERLWDTRVTCMETGAKVVALK